MEFLNVRKQIQQRLVIDLNIGVKPGGFSFLDQHYLETNFIFIASSPENKIWCKKSNTTRTWDVSILH